MVELNLLPDVKLQYIETQRLKRNIISLSSLAVIVAVGVVVLLGFYVHVVQTVALNNVKKDVANSQNTLNNIPQLQKILTVQDALSALPSLKDQQMLNSRMFNYLPVLVPAQVVLNKLDIEQQPGTVQFIGVAPDYTTLNVFSDDLKDAQLTYGTTGHQTTIQPFHSVVITSADESNDPQSPGVDFTITLDFNPLIFAESTPNPTMNIPNVSPNQQFAQSGKIFGGSGQ